MTRKKIRPIILEANKNVTSDVPYLTLIYWYCYKEVNFEVGSVPATKFLIIYQYLGEAIRDIRSS